MQDMLTPLDAEEAAKTKLRLDMREIPKSSIKPEHFHLMYLLEQHSPYFIDAELTELRDSFQIHYDINDNHTPFDNIKSFTKMKNYVTYSISKFRRSKSYTLHICVGTR